MNEKIPGIFIPKEIIERFEKVSDAKEASVAIATETIRSLKADIQGVHLMAIGWEDLIPKITSQI